MKKKLSNKTFFYRNQPYTAAAPLEGDEMMRPASPKACLWPAAHKVSTKGKCGAPWSPNRKQTQNTYNQLFKRQRNALKERIVSKNTRLRLDL